jgi:hypothetical protein
MKGKLTIGKVKDAIQMDAAITKQPMEDMEQVRKYNFN